MSPMSLLTLPPAALREAYGRPESQAMQGERNERLYLSVGLAVLSAMTVLTVILI